MFERLQSLPKRVLSGDRNSISKALSLVENGDKGSSELMKELFVHTGKAHVVGITGPLGTGKSSLVDRLVKLYRAKGKAVAVLAVDPSSPISGGALLGDRIRMLEHSLDPSVYIRSMASRGEEGGLSRAAKDAVRILDAAGFEIIFVETVGIGQTEVDVIEVTDTVVVVLMPELGDEIQAAKAGLVEIGDIFAVNKGDLPGADIVLYNLNSMLAKKESGWQQIGLKVSAKSSEGLPDLQSAIDRHYEFLQNSPTTKTETNVKLRYELTKRISEIVLQSLEDNLVNDSDFNSILEKLRNREIDPHSAADKIAKKYLLNGR